MGGSTLSTANLPWHAPLLERCSNMMKGGRLPHALLLRGRRGDGLLQAAQSLASLCLCMQPVGSVACGECKSCQLVGAGSHPDLQLLQPEEPSRVIKIDAVRNLVKQFSHTPQIASWKVAALYLANYLNISAANALLKTLEEPPGQSLLILAVDQHARVMPTLQSRCQLLEVPRPNRQQATEWLGAHGVGQAEELLDATAGEPLKAREWQDIGMLDQWREFRNLLIRLARGEVSLAQAAAATDDIPVMEKLHWYMDFLRQLLEVACSDQHASQQLLQCFDQALEITAELERGTNPNLQLLSESLLMQWQRIGGSGGITNLGSVRV